MADVLIAAAAEQDYTEALSWYAQRSERAAHGFEAEFKRAIQTIETAPQRCPFCDSSHRFYLMRRYPFQVIYREASGHVLIVAVAHSKRRPGYWQGR
jgi:plasmid stabilization system protein ParE